MKSIKDMYMRNINPDISSGRETNIPFKAIPILYKLDTYYRQTIYANNKNLYSYILFFRSKIEYSTQIILDDII